MDFGQVLNDDCLVGVGLGLVVGVILDHWFCWVNFMIKELCLLLKSIPIRNKYFN